MKKNMLSLLALLLAVVSLVLSIILFIKVQKNTSHIENIASALNVDMETGSGDEKDGTLSISDMEPVAVKWDSQQTYNLKADGSGTDHYAMMKGYTLYLNKNADDFKDVKEQLSADHAQIDGIISSVISNHTSEEATPELVVKEALEQINQLLNSKSAVKLVLDGYVRQ